MEEPRKEDKQPRGQIVDYTFKIMLMSGEKGVGKSRLQDTFVGDADQSDYVKQYKDKGLKEKTIEVRGKNIRLYVWDEREENRYLTINNVIRSDNADAWMLLFDLTRKLPDIKEYLDVKKFLKDSGIDMILVFNKSDLVSERVITDEEAHTYAEMLGCQYVETSAINNTGVDEAFLKISTTRLNRQPEQIREDSLQKAGELVPQLIEILKNQKWHLYTSHHRQPNGFKELEEMLQKIEDKTEDEVVDAINKIATKYTGPVVKRSFLPNGVRNENLREIYLTMSRADSLNILLEEMNKEIDVPEVLRQRK